MAPTFVLVHGSFVGSWCWDRVRVLLEEAGASCSSPTLTGLAETAKAATPDIGLSTHVDDVVAVIEAQDLEDVVLVGHSYAGMVITGAALRVPERICRMVYVDAFIAEPGRSCFDVAPWLKDLFEANLVPGQQWLVAPMDLRNFGIEDPADEAYAATKVTPMPLRALSEPLQEGDRGALSAIPTTFVHLTRQPFFDDFADKARQRGWPVIDLDLPHMAQITDPKPVARALLDIADSSA